jgi:hypothetical protein
MGFVHLYDELLEFSSFWGMGDAQLLRNRVKVV